MSARPRVVVASPGGWGFVSTQYRLGPLARRADWELDVVSAGSLPTGEQVDALLERADDADGTILLLQRVLPTAADLRRLRRAYRRIALDFDDAIYAVPPALRERRAVRVAKGAARLALRGSPARSLRRRALQRTLRAVDACVAGNAILADFARRHAPRVVEIPTTMDPVPERPAGPPEPPVLVWMGVPDNLQYLRLVARVLPRLRTPFSLQIVSARPWEEATVPAEHVPWSPEAARTALLGATAGLAPLTDDPWTRGKCAFRAIQYGAHGLPAVASPVGITDRVVLQARTGYLARSEEEWLAALSRLLEDPERARSMGAAAREHVRAHYSDGVAVSRWSALLESLTG